MLLPEKGSLLAIYAHIGYSKGVLPSTQTLSALLTSEPAQTVTQAVFFLSVRLGPNPAGFQERIAVAVWINIHRILLTTIWPSG